jgi:hypothetical protein
MSSILADSFFFLLTKTDTNPKTIENNIFNTVKAMAIFLTYSNTFNLLQVPTTHKVVLALSQTPLLKISSYLSFKKFLYIDAPIKKYKLRTSKKALTPRVTNNIGKNPFLRCLKHEYVVVGNTNIYRIHTNNMSACA